MVGRVARRYDAPMRPNLSDPSYEPTDDEIGQLMRRAFQDVAAERAASLVRLRAEVARASREARALLGATPEAPGAKRPR